MTRYLALLLLLLAPTMFLRATEWHRVLLPIYFQGEIAGAFGSRWVVELGGYNGFGTHQRVTSFPGYPCTRPSQCADYIPPGEFFNPTFTIARDGDNIGRFIYTRSTFEGVESPSSVRFSIVTRDVSRQTEGFGTQVPAVREEDTFAGSLPFPSIPMGPRYRQKLRVYDFDGELGHSVDVKVFRAGSVIDAFIVLAERTLVLSSGSVGQYPTDPGYAELDLSSLPELTNETDVDVVVSPLQEGRFWACVSVTNNDTQQVTLLAP